MGEVGRREVAETVRCWGGDEGATLVAARRTTTLGSLQTKIINHTNKETLYNPLIGKKSVIFARWVSSNIWLRFRKFEFAQKCLEFTSVVYFFSNFVLVKYPEYSLWIFKLFPVFAVYPCWWLKII
jgi:hypothetical protein